MSFEFDGFFRFDECDPAGIYFFGKVPELCHRVYESWLLKLNSDWSYWFNNPEWIIPIKECRVDYRSPMPAGADFSINLSISEVRTSSFTTRYRARQPKTGIIYFEAHCVHVFTAKSTFQKRSIPEIIKNSFQGYLSEN